MDAKNASAEANVARILKKLLICSLTIIGIPLVSLFVAKKSFFENYLKYSSEDSFLYSAIVAIILIHVVLGVFVYMAYSESATVSPEPPTRAHAD